MKKSNFVSSLARKLFHSHRSKRQDREKQLGSVTGNSEEIRVFRDDMWVGLDRQFSFTPHVHLEVHDPLTGKITTNNKVQIEVTAGNQFQNGDQFYDHPPQLH